MNKAPAESTGSRLLEAVQDMTGRYTGKQFCERPKSMSGKSVRKAPKVRRSDYEDDKRVIRNQPGGIC